jgi:hypothetical protein
MCGAPKTQEVVQRTELDPALRRLLYGGTMANPRGGFGSGDSGSGSGAVPPGDGGGADFSMGGYDGGLMGGGLGYGLDGGADRADTAAVGGLYAMGGYVTPQQGIASLNQGQMPMQNGSLPNLSDPMTAATLAMAVRQPEMRYGSIMKPRANFAMGGYVEGPGTGTSDSIPAAIYQNGMPVQEARLSDGEFVMTENAVRGAGNGDREAGAARMYEMMRQFERGGRV